MDAQLLDVRTLNTMWKILVIDHDEDDYLIARDMLKRIEGRKCDVHWASTFEAGQKELTEDHYDAVLVDQNLGFHSGIELIREANQREYSAPLILLIGRGKHEVVVEAMQAGVTLFITKDEMNSLLLERVILYAIERKQIGIHLRDSNERLDYQAKLLQNIHDAVIATDANRIITVWNRGAEKLYGWTAEEAIGCPVQKMIPSEWTLEQSEQAMRDLVEKGSYTSSMVQYTRDGRKMWVECHGMSLLDASGQVTGQVSTTRDNTDLKETQEALRKSEAKYRTFFENLRESVVLFEVVRDAQGNLLDFIARDANPPALTLMGLERETTLNRLASDLFPIEALERAIVNIPRLLETGEPWTDEQLFNDRYFLYTLFRIDNHMIAVSTQDITEGKLAEETLLKAHEKANWLARFPDENPNPVARVAANGSILYCNPTSAKLPGWEYRVGQPLVEPLMRLVERAMAQGQEVKGDVQLADRSFAVSVMPILEENYANLYGIDITEREIAEVALQKSEQKYRALFESSVDAVFLTTPDGAIEAVNPAGCAMLGWSEQEILNLGRSGVLDINDPRLANAIEERQRTGRIQSRELTAIRKSGEKFPVEVDSVILLADPVRSFVIIRDITERKRAEKELLHYAQELERSNQALQDFAFVASHDLQEPLRKIIMFNEIVRRHSGETLDHEAKEYMDRIQNAIERMQALINGLLELSQVNALGRDFTPVNLTRIVEEVVSDLEVRIQAVNGQVTIGDLPAIVADELQLRQLFQNLIGNALKFHKPGVPPEVSVSGTIIQTKISTTVEIRVEDKGIGFEQQHAERIFQPFQKLHGKNEYEGTGLGLAICQKIIDRHHGTIEVRSVPGTGTTFTMHLMLKPSF